MPKYSKYHTKPQEKRFVKEYIKTGNAKQSALEAFNVKESSAGQVAHQKLKQDHIQVMIKEAMAAENLDPQWVIKQRKQIIEKGMKELDSVKIAPSDIEKNLTGLEKLMLLNGNKGENSNSHQHLHLHGSLTRQEVLDKRQEVSSFFEDIQTS